MISQNAIDTLRKVEIGARGLFIDGVQTAGMEGATLPVTSPIDGRPFASIADGNAADIDRAVASARKAFEKGSWSRAAPAFRKKVLTKLAELVEKHVDELAVLGVRDNGTEIGMAYKAEPLSAAGTIRYYAEAIDKVYGEIAPTAGNVLGLIHKEPLGVVGVIVPWNFPLMIGAWKIAPALAAGNCVVLKPPEIASLTLLRLAELGSEAGLPAGVLNVVTGAARHRRGARPAYGCRCHRLHRLGPVGRRLLDTRPAQSEARLPRARRQVAQHRLCRCPT